MSGATATVASVERMAATSPALAHLSCVRVCGTLTESGRIDSSSGREPVAWLHLQFQPPQGLPYVARMCLGTDVAERMRADAELPLLRPGALVSVSGRALELRSDHGHAALRVVDAHALVLIPPPAAPLRVAHPPTHQPTQQQEA